MPRSIESREFQLGYGVTVAGSLLKPTRRRWLGLGLGSAGVLEARLRLGVIWVQFDRPLEVMDSLVKFVPVRQHNAETGTCLRRAGPEPNGTPEKRFSLC